MPLAYTIVVHNSDLAATILAALGIGLALLSLAWQAWSFLLSGSRVTVEVRSGLRSATGALTIPGTANATALEQDACAGFFTNPHLLSRSTTRDAVRLQSSGSISIVETRQSGPFDPKALIAKWTQRHNAMREDLKIAD
jgi:hypothetical protein